MNTSTSQKLRLNVACSGGGIRSASFACGALEYLNKNCEIESISSVSGGGYIASSFIDNRERVFSLFESNVGYICDLNWLEFMCGCQNMDLLPWITSIAR